VALEAPDDVALADKLRRGRDQIISELRKLIIGQDDVIEQSLTALYAGGNCLIVGVPGLAKTLLIHSIAQVLDLRFSRIQFTPDLMPSDITGTDIIQEDANTGRRAMNFVPGPIFANIVLADEINRTPPKTQSALLEAMQEHRVTVQGRTYPLEEPFFVFATQNPIELEGTYPLPEAQLDRFMFQVNMGYLEEDEELDVVHHHGDPELPLPARGDRARHRRLPEARPARADRRARRSLCGASRAGDTAGVEHRAGFHQEVGLVRRLGARGAVPRAGRQGARTDARALPRELRGHSGPRAPGDAPPHPHELSRAVRAGHHRPDS